MPVLSSIPEVQGQVILDGQTYSVCMRPEWNRLGCVVCNFRRFKSRGIIEEHRLYANDGPHITVSTKADEFFDLLEFNKVINSEHEGCSVLKGSMDMLQGYPATEFPTEHRKFDAMSVVATRTESLTRFSFSAFAGARIDKVLPASINLSFWFEIPDDWVDRFILDDMAKNIFMEKIAEYENFKNG